MHAADTLSHAAIADDIRNTDLTELDIEDQVAAMIKYVPITDRKMNKIKRMTASELTMQILKNYITHGWPETIKSCKNEIKSYFNNGTELVLFYDIILKGECIIMTAQLRTNILEKIHAGHHDQEKCRFWAWVSIFWLGINKDIERIVQKSKLHMTYKDAQPKQPLIHRQIPPTQPW